MQLAAGREDDEARCGARGTRGEKLTENSVSRFESGAGPLLLLGRRFQDGGGGSGRQPGDALECAAAAFGGLGSPGWAEITRSELRAHRRDARPGAAGGLTAAERRVAELAAEGLANKEIAQTLFISVHTVEVQLSKAYAKLGIRSRAQLAGRPRARVAHSRKSAGFRYFTALVHRRSVGGMAEFLVETYVARTDSAAVELGAERSRLAAEELTREGTPVRCLRSIFVPEDETCFFLYEADSADTMRAAVERCGFAVPPGGGAVQPSGREASDEETRSAGRDSGGGARPYAGRRGHVGGFDHRREDRSTVATRRDKASSG